MNKNLFSFYTVVSSIFLLNCIFFSNLSFAAASSVDAPCEFSATERDFGSPYERAIQRAEEVLGFSIESRTEFRDLNMPPPQRNIDRLIDWWEATSKSPGSLVNMRSCFSIFSLDESFKSRRTPKERLEYKLARETSFKQFSDALRAAQNIAALFKRHTITPLKNAFFNSDLSVADAGKLEINLRKTLGEYEAFNTFQAIIQEFVKWLDTKGQFGPIVYVYSTDHPHFCEYSRTEITKKEKQLKGRIYFVQDLNGWVPYFISNFVFRVESPFFCGFSFGNFETGQINRALIMKPGKDFDLITMPGFYVQKRSWETELQVLLYSGVFPQDPKVSMRYRGVEICISEDSELMRFLRGKLKESHSVTKVEDTEGCYHAPTAFFPKGSEDYKNFLAYLVEHINLLQQGYVSRLGSSSPFLIDILAEYCQQEPIDEEEFLIPNTETQTPSEKRKRKKKKNIKKERGAQKEKNFVCVEEEESYPPKEEESMGAFPVDACEENNTDLLEVRSVEDVSESSTRLGESTFVSDSGESAETISREDIPDAEGAKRSPKEFMVSLVQELMETIPEGRMNNRMVMSLLNNWLKICQRECGLEVTSITHKGSHTTLHTNKGGLTFAPKHGGKGDRKFAPGELREKARELCALAAQA